MKKRKIAFFDWDGTLSADGKTVSAENRAAVAAFRAAGNFAVLCTGRCLGFLPPAALTLPMDGVIAGAGIDVQVKEPMAADNPLLTAPHCILTPHIAWAPFETRVRLIDRVAENLSAFQNGNPFNTVI